MSEAFDEARAEVALFAALVDLQAEMPVIAKDSTANTGQYKYDYADLAAVSQALKPLLGKHGLAFTAKPTLNAEGKFVLAYKLIHKLGGRDSGEYALPTSGTPQQIGSAITYARRYCLCAVTGAAPGGDDDDGKAAEHSYRHSASDRSQQQRRDRPEQGGRPASARPASAGAVPQQRGPESAPDDEAQFVAAFKQRLGKADLTAVRNMRIEMAKAVQAKVIAPETANELGGLLRERSAALEGVSDDAA